MNPYSQLYGQPLASPEVVYQAIITAVEKKRPLSLVRAGDIVTYLLYRKFGRIRTRVYGFLGIPNPPPERLVKELHQAVASADILGLAAYKSGGVGLKLQAYIRKHHIRPALLVHPYVSYKLREQGFLESLLTKYRVALVGRSAAKAACHYSEQTISFPLDHWNEVNATARQLTSRADEWDVALIGAGVPGRILCGRLRQVGKIAIDIGHSMDALAYPETWNRVKSGRYFKQKYLQKQYRKPQGRRRSSFHQVQTYRSEGQAYGWSVFSDFH